MAWEIRFPGKSPVRLDDLPIKEFSSVADHHGMSWLVLLQTPGADAQAYVELLGVVAARVGADVPEAATAGQIRALLELCVFVESDLPAVWSDDTGPPAGEPLTGSTSGSPKITAGRKRS